MGDRRKREHTGVAGIYKRVSDNGKVRYIFQLYREFTTLEDAKAMKDYIEEVYPPGRGPGCAGNKRVYLENNLYEISCRTRRSYEVYIKSGKVISQGVRRRFRDIEDARKFRDDVYKGHYADKRIKTQPEDKAITVNLDVRGGKLVLANGKWELR